MNMQTHNMYTYVQTCTCTCMFLHSFTHTHTHAHTHTHLFELDDFLLMCVSSSPSPPIPSPSPSPSVAIKRVHISSHLPSRHISHHISRHLLSGQKNTSCIHVVVYTCYVYVYTRMYNTPVHVAQYEKMYNYTYSLAENFWDSLAKILLLLATKATILTCS